MTHVLVNTIYVTGMTAIVFSVILDIGLATVETFSLFEMQSWLKRFLDLLANLSGVKGFILHSILYYVIILSLDRKACSAFTYAEIPSQCLSQHSGLQLTRRGFIKTYLIALVKKTGRENIAGVMVSLKILCQCLVADGSFSQHNFFVDLIFSRTDGVGDFGV